MSIANILSNEQRIKDNLSSRQLFNILDSLLFRALYPISCVLPRAAKELAAEILIGMTFSRRLKLSDEQQSKIFVAMFSSSKELTAAVVNNNLDRSFLFKFLYKIDLLSKEYSATIISYERKKNKVTNDILESLCKIQKVLGTHADLQPALRDASFWTHQATDFKAQILEKYLKTMYSKSSSAVRNSPIVVDVNDVFSTAYLTASTALDRFSSDKGVFTTYLSNWMANVVKSRRINGIGLAFGSTAKHVDNNALFSVSLDKAESVQDVSATSSTEISKELLRQIEVIADDVDVKNALLVSSIAPTEALSLTGE